MEFKEIGLEDKNIIEKYLRQTDYNGAEMCFSSLYLWCEYYCVTYAIVEDMLTFRSCNKKGNYFFPIGNGNLKAAIEKLIEYAKEHNQEFKLYNVTKSMFDKLEEIYPDTFKIEYDRDSADYVYLAEELINLSGKKFHGKKNHINKFIKMYGDNYSYETLSSENEEECYAMLEEWGRLNNISDDEDKQNEMNVAKKSILLRDKLGLKGGILRVDGKIAAFSIGEKIGGDTFLVHIEKAFTDIQGAYPMINREFLKHESEGAVYVNREDDMGSEGLRKAKLSYKPVYLLEKGYVTFK